jgi:hypothetical protein
MKLIAISLVAALGLSAAACTPAQTQTASAVVAGICAGAAAGAVAIAADGTIMNASSAAQAKVAAGTQMIPVNCAFANTAVAAIAAASAASPTALVSVENEYASKLHISPALLDRVVKHYTGK